MRSLGSMECLGSDAVLWELTTCGRVDGGETEKMLRQCARGMKKSLTVLQIESTHGIDIHQFSECSEYPNSQVVLLPGTVIHSETQPALFIKKSKSRSGNKGLFVISCCGGILRNIHEQEITFLE